MQRPVVERVPIGHLHDLAEVHDRDPVGDVPYDRQIVGNHHIGQSELPLQVVEEVDDLRLDRHVQRGNRFVGDDELGPQRQRAGDADALPLSAGELVRIAVVVLRVEADGLEQFLHRPLHALRGLDALDAERRGDDRADGVPGVQRREWVLEDHLHVAAERAQPALRHVLMS